MWLCLELHHLCYLITGPGSVATGIGAIVITHLLAFVGAVCGHLVAGLRDITIQWRIMLHEVRGCLADLGAVLQHRNVFGLGVLATRLLAVCSRLHANIMTAQAILNTLL